MPSAQIQSGGTLVDVSAYGLRKTIFVDDAYEGNLILQASGNDTDWADIARLTNGGTRLALDLMAKSLRFHPTRGGATAAGNVYVSGESATQTRATIPMPAAGATGATVSTAALGVEKTVIVAGDFEGMLLVEGLVSSIPEVVAVFQGASGAQHVTGVFDEMRIRRVRGGSGTPVAIVVARDAAAAGASGSFAETLSGANLTADLNYTHHALTVSGTQTYILPNGTAATAGVIHTVRVASAAATPNANMTGLFRAGNTNFTTCNALDTLSDGFMVKWDTDVNRWNVLMNVGCVFA